MIGIRPRTVDDIADCVALLAQVHALGHYPTQWPRDPARWLSPDGPANQAAWVAVLDGRVVGHTLLLHDGDGGPVELARFFVKPTLYGNGIGAALHATATEWADERGLKMVLCVNADSDRAWKAYEHWGWRRTGTQLADWTTPDGDPVYVHNYERDASAR